MSVSRIARDVPNGGMLVRSGIKLIKYWFSITDEEQQLRFLGRIHDPLKQRQQIIREIIVPEVY